jgi:hypothetical protein
MSGQVTLEQVEQQAAQLPPHEQLKLVAHISERLSLAVQEATPTVVGNEESLRQQRQREADELLALCDTAAGLWEGEFDAVEEIRQMRQERDDQVWQSRS